MHTPRLHRDTVEQIKERAEIVDVVSEYVVLRKRGKDYVGLCPFHNEKTPSFSVSPSRQSFYCFGCQAGGDAIKFLMDIHKQPFAEVVLDLARRYQVPVQTLEPEQRQELQRQISERSQLYELLATADQFYQHALRQPQGEVALNYLRQQRQIKDETIQEFGLGYAPGGWETLYRYLVDSKRYPPPLLEKAGLIKPRKENSGYYDVFRDRLMIPIRDIMGRVIAFGGRTLGDEQPKYLNSPETELFNKGKTLFALDKAKTGISQQDQAIVVEGYFDAIALHAAGIDHVVASLGTALSIEQVRILLRYSESKQLILNFDADKAGTNAAQRAIGEISQLAYQGEVQLKILNIPDGKDADEYLQTHTTQDYQQLIVNAPLWLNWQIQQIIQDKDLKQPGDFQQVSQEFVKLIKNIANTNTREYYITHCAEILSQGDTRLVALRVENLLTQVSPGTENKQNFRQFTSNKSSASSKSYLTQTEPSLLEQAEALLLRIYLHCPENRLVISTALEERDLQFSLSHHRFLWQQILEIIPENYGDELLTAVQQRCLEFPEETDLVSHIFHLNEKAKKEIQRTPQVIQAAIACMEIAISEKRCRYFRESWEQTEPEKEPEQYKYYADAFTKEKRNLQELEKQRLFSLLDLLQFNY
ncbi:DNA primase [Calothrix sp. 336/3]|uniref:DNA primase n=1 Tax=Calothrix sp. 336/3 TaxID=1337936 RepID=UPI0004E427A1|nr:DNA primase [Calothrix sp. 336/3]AKG21708.1 DNA primase [Calothrix sp. 336/3]